MYDPATNSWAPLATAGAPSARWPASWAWTGHKLLVWAGYDGSSFVNTGGLYDPSDQHLDVHQYGRCAGADARSDLRVDRG